MAQPPAPMGGPVPIHERGSPHGRTSSWTLVGTVIAAFVVGGLAMILHIWWLFWIAVAVVLISVPAGGLIGIMHDTVAWDHDRSGGGPPPRDDALQEEEEEQEEQREQGP